MQTLGGTLRGEITGLRGDMETMGGSLRGEMAAMGVSLREEMYALHGITVLRFEKLERALADSVDETRRFMKVLHEDTLSRIALLGEGYLALGRQMTEMEANLNAGFETRIRTTELVLQDHGRRLIVLETPKS
jgi:hypothetical protein